MQLIFSFQFSTLFGCFAVDVGGDGGEDDVREPYQKYGHRALATLGYLLEDAAKHNVGEAEYHTDTDVHTRAAAHLARGERHAYHREDEYRNGVGKTLLAKELNKIIEGLGE